MRLTRPRLLRLAALLALAAAFAPGTWWRVGVPDRYATPVRVDPLPFDGRAHNGLTVKGLWQLNGKGENTGGYSAMVLYGHAGLRLFSDRGSLLTIPRPGPDVVDPLRKSTDRLHPAGFAPETLLDIESVTRDPATGQFWVGYEGPHTIYRYSARDEPEAVVLPEYTQGWPGNGGIEALVRLADGRFVVLHEDSGDIYLYPADPAEGAEPEHARIAWPGDYSPTDAAQLPDGRLIVVLRRVALAMPLFECRLLLVDLADFRSGATLQPQPLVQLESLLPRENWEAVAVEPGSDGAVSLWLASDDNRSAFQRSLLANLRFVPPPPSGNRP